MSEYRYKNFAENVYKEKKFRDLATAMKEEMIRVIKESPTPEEASEIIMELVLATKYEW